MSRKKIKLSDEILFGKPKPKKKEEDNLLMEKAAIMGKFTMADVKKWGVQKPNDDLLSELNSNSKVVGEIDNKIVKVLNESTRIKFLEKILKRDNYLDQLDTLEKIKGLNDDSKFTIQFLKREVKPLSDQTLEELAQCLKLARWVEPLNLDYPNPNEIYAEMKRKEFLKPLEEITQNFEGREEDLRTLKKYVDWLPRESLFEKAAGFFKDIIKWHKSKPMLITGIGGIGKSALVSQFIMLHRKDSNQLPFIYIDFDNSLYSISEPLFVLSEALNQLKIQFPKLEKEFEVLNGILDDLVFNKRRYTSKENSSDSFRNMIYRKLLDRLKHLDLDLGMIDRPILAVFDSFEELQYRGANKTEFHTFLETIKEICEHVPRIRPVFVGRSEIEFKEVEFETINLTSFDKKSATAYLSKLEIKNTELREKIYHNFGGNPLTLQLAASLAKQEGLADAKRISIDRMGQLFKNLDESSIQKELVTRNLDHIHNADVRKIAMPGLLVRKVNPVVIQKILARPCGLGKISLNRATEVFNLLEAETFLIQANRETGKIVFRPELRKAMEDMVWKKNPTSAQAIHDNAVEYYSNESSVEDQAECVYHRLKRGDDPSFLDSEGYKKISTFLDRSLDELPLDAQIHIAGLRGSKFSKEKLKQTKLDDWEDYYAKVIQDGLKGGLHNLQSIRKELKQRKERSFNSSLHYWEARLYQRLNKISLSDRILDKAIKEIQSTQNSDSDELLIRLLIVQIENREYEFEFDEAFEKLEEIAPELVEYHDPFIALQMEVLRIRLEARLKKWTINLEQQEINYLKIDFEKNDTYKVYESYYTLNLFDNNFPYNTLHLESYLEEFKVFKTRYSNDQTLGDYANKYLGNFLTGLSEPGEYDIVVKDVFNRSNKNIIDQINVINSNQDKPIMILADLYPSIEAAKRILRNAHIYTEHFSWKHSAIRNWEMIYYNLEKSDSTLTLLKIAVVEYPKNEALKRYLQQVEDRQTKLPISKKIVDQLMRRYPTIESSKLLLNFSGIPTNEINFDSDARENWLRIITELHRTNDLNSFFQNIIEHTDDKNFLADLKNESGITLLRDASDVYQEELSFDKNKLKKLFISGKLKEALSKLRSISNSLSENFQNNVILLGARLNSIENSNIIGIISYNDYKLEINKITQVFLHTIDEIDKEIEIKSITRNLENRSIKTSSYLNVPNKQSFEKVLSRNENLVSTDWFTQATKTSKIVCLVEVIDGTMCTGFLIKGGYLLTASHILWKKNDIDNLRITLNSKIDIEATIQYQMDPKHTFIMNKKLDYALIKIKDRTDYPIVDWGYAEIESFKIPVINDMVNIIQHPQGGHKKIAMPDNVISVWEEENAIFYQADTRPGSSGAPIFNQDWKVIAIHQAGNKSQGGLIINAKGDRQGANRGTLIKFIIEDIRSQGVEI